MKQKLMTAALLVTSLALFAGSLTVVGTALRQPVTGTVLTVTKETETQPLEEIRFPYAIEGTPLTVEQTVVYEGPMLEKESDEPTVDVLALLVHNTGSQEILSTQIELQGEDATYCFSGSHIPAGGRALLVEESNAKWSLSPYTQCSATVQTLEDPGFTGEEIRVEEIGMCQILLTNLTDNTLTELCIYHKNFLEGMDVCIGGITYRTQLDALEPGEQRKVILDHYAAGYSKIVRIE